MSVIISYLLFPTDEAADAIDVAAANVVDSVDAFSDVDVPEVDG